MKMRLPGFIAGILMSATLHAFSISAFVSFSMPETLLEETLKDCVRLNVPVFLNGLHQDSMKATAIKVMNLNQHIPGLNLQIDPTAFERFGIKQVPALVVENQNDFDVIYGHLPLKEGLSRMADRGESGFTKEDLRRVRGG